MCKLEIPSSRRAGLRNDKIMISFRNIEDSSEIIDIFEMILNKEKDNEIIASVGYGMSEMFETGSGC
jgi:hypothetical protein